jgi:hypothetical protein
MWNQKGRQLLSNDSVNMFSRRQVLGKQSIVAIIIRDKNETYFLCGPRRDCLLGNCVVTRLYNNRGAVFSVLRGHSVSESSNRRDSSFRTQNTEEDLYYWMPLPSNDYVMIQQPGETWNVVYFRVSDIEKFQLPIRTSWLTSTRDTSSGEWIKLQSDQWLNE